MKNRNCGNLPHFPNKRKLSMSLTEQTSEQSYQDWLNQLKTQIRSSQQRAILAVNQELVLLYWQIGQNILQRQDQQGWGAKVKFQGSVSNKNESQRKSDTSAKYHIDVKAIDEGAPEGLMKVLDILGEAIQPAE